MDRKRGKKCVPETKQKRIQKQELVLLLDALGIKMDAVSWRLSPELCLGYWTRRRGLLQ